MANGQVGGLHFPSELPLECVRDLVAAVRAGRYLETETIDHALYAAGCVNALRGGPQPFGAGLEEAPVNAETATEEELADTLEAGMSQAGFSATGDASAETSVDAAALPPWLAPILLTLAQRILERWLKRKDGE
jgi:hypothetical protein